MSYTKQVSHQTKKIRKQKFIMELVKQHFSSDMQNIKKTFNNIKCQTDTELSNKDWNIISANKTSNISWKILGTRKSSNQNCKRCLLCLNEKAVNRSAQSREHAKQKIRSNKQIQEQKQIHTSQL